MQIYSRYFQGLQLTAGQSTLSVAFQQQVTRHCYSTPNCDLELQHRLLDAALGHVGNHGWTTRALEEAADQLGLSRAVTGIFSQNPVKLVEHFTSKCDKEYQQELAATVQTLAGMPLPDRIAQAVWMRLQYNQQFNRVGLWRQALSLHIQPPNAPSFLQQRLELMDGIWKHIGSKDDDDTIQWHARRSLLASLYAYGELYALDDAADDTSHVLTALQARAKDVVTLGDGVQAATRTGHVWQEYGDILLKQMRKKV